ncbi:hypothetical protein D9757_005765 [Collybiopsis confluens]|uniref:rRNA N-glycosylase n=1 Tax=Collybiopsis confluens TaxID=2823264 RepID=A0A8H5MAZ3_9AGAR|nr:hypothetical protein D9757_005765 [Collybiopsis confluens]
MYSVQGLTQSETDCLGDIRADHLKFTTYLNMNDGGEDGYTTFIEDLRSPERLAVGDTIENVPALAADGGANLGFFDVYLSTGDYTVQVRFRTDNLYLIGYRPANVGQESDVWYELRHGRQGTEPFLIVDPHNSVEYLPFGEGYDALTQTSGTRLENVPVGYNAMTAAITTLAQNADDPTGQNRAKAIFTLIVAISEATRFRAVSDLVARSWWDPSSPGLDNAYLIRNWSRLSNVVQSTRYDGYMFDFNGGGISSFAQAILALGIMHYTNPANNANALELSQPTPSNTSMASSFTLVQSWLEIVSVTVDNIDGQDRNLYGTISVTDSAGTEIIWSCDKASYIQVSPDEAITMQGPSRGLYAADELSINVNIRELSTGNAFANGAIEFRPLDYYTQHDIFKHEQVPGDFGSVTVNYRAITNGLYARITVILISADGQGSIKTYGYISTMTNHGLEETEIFWPSSGQNIFPPVVAIGNSIPLSKSVVSVSAEGSLQVNASLFDRSGAGASDAIVWDSANFQPLYNQSEKKRLTGPRGEIEVQVTWI